MSNNTNATATPAATPSPFNNGDIAWTLASTALVFIMIPGVGYFYSGMARSKNALSLIMLGMLSAAVVSFQWWLWGYSLTFGPSSSHFIGNLDHALLLNVGFDPQASITSTVPALVYAIYQCMFAAITPALAIGSAAERGRVVPAIIFIFIWSTIVYDVIACWTWNVDGWANKLGTLDFAGGTPVHIASGTAALAYCIIVELSANTRAATACVVTNLAASVGGLVWAIMDYRLEKKLSALGFCSGVVAGLVAITPASGYVEAYSGAIFGLFAGICCNLAVKLKHLFDFDDALDVFAVHAVGGLVGNILTGIFASRRVFALDGLDHPGGWIDGNWIQMGYQLANSGASIVYTFVVTYIILFVMDKIPGLSLRADLDSETKGLDESELGELAYYHVDRLVTVNARTGETKTVKEETIHQQNDTNVSIM
ncbi:7198_t:CDS:2 [Dentiscutata heterogama]|uniref:7198_t:CDS:1 n=1 Tax=Dentiscutata heterogama TaxID=1316150 RepID=A0ACA9JYA5_9GLOM|nr:7198_t:CDS:2 [Dentiscutata heterogama]